MSFVKVLLLALILISCSSKEGKVDSDSEELEIVRGNSIEKLFESHQIGSVPKIVNKNRPSRFPSSVPKTYDIFSFKDPNGLLTKKIGEYVVKDNNETLMLLAYNLYGDFRYWKSIAHLNKDFLPSPYNLREGIRLKYYLPKRDYVYRPDGNPFLIKRGHSLSKISDIVYENWRRWPEIYDNNKPMIKDPDRIYAGFTLYYLEDDDLAFSSNRLSKVSRKVSFNNENRLFKLMMKNIKTSKFTSSNKKLPMTWSLDRLKEKLKQKRAPASNKNKIDKVHDKFKLTNKEKNAIKEIKKAVKVDQKRIKKEKAESSLLDKVKNSFKQFDYY